MNKPQELSMAEWNELMHIPAIREMWGLEDGDSTEQFAEMVYAVKFRYSAGMMPGYVGDLYILHGDAMGEPVTLIRNDGVLVIV